MLARLALVGVALAAAPAAGFELVSAVAGRDGSTYQLDIEARFRATPEGLLAVLTDYARVHELHPALLESRSLGAVAPDTEEVYTRFEGCVLLFCRTLHRVERIRLDGLTLVAEDVPARGSFAEGNTTWRLEPDGDGTRLRYSARFVPAFAVLPLFGPGVLSRSLERMTLESMAEADRRALARND